MTNRDKIYLSILETAVMKAKRELEEVRDAYYRKEKNLGEYYEALNYYKMQAKCLQDTKKRLSAN